METLLVLPQNANGASGGEPPTPDTTTTLLRSNFSGDFQSLVRPAADAAANRWPFLPAERIPDDLIECDQWVLWTYEAVDGRPTKVPYTCTGRKASTTNPADWCDYDSALVVCKRFKYDGVGFVFTDLDSFVGIDLDNCLHDTTGDPQPCVRPMLERFADTYMETSPSGLGVKIFCRGKLPAEGIGKTELEDGCAIEMYDRARYFTVTGNIFRNAPLQIEDHAGDVMSLFEALRGRGSAKYNIPTQGKIRYGTQHLTLVSLAGTLRRRHVCNEAIEACLQAVNRYQCEKPGPPANVSRIVRSSQRWGWR